MCLFQRRGMIGRKYRLIHSVYFCDGSSSPLLLRGAPDTALILCRSFMPKRHWQLRVKDLPKVPTWLLEWYANPRPFGRTATKPYSIIETLFEETNEIHSIE